MATVLVTGTSTGIGNATALHLARAGYDVFATMRRPDKHPDLRQAAEKESLNLHVLQQDVTDPASNQSVVDEVTALGGQIDILVNNAGKGGASSLEEIPMEELRDVFETNFFGAIDLTQKVVPQMRERRSGCIVNVTSVAGRVSVSPQIAYSSSKVALESISEMLAQELWQYNVRVATIEPGIVITPILEQFTPPEHPTPYIQQFERMGLFFQSGINMGTMPDVVAKAIQQAIETDTPKLRNLVGADVEGIMKLRNTFSDDEWVAFVGEAAPLHEWKVKASELSGLPL